MPDALLTGFAAADITPPLPVRLAGYGDRRGDATTAHDRLEARAVVLEAGDTRLCLLTLDLLALSADFANPIRDAIAAVLDVERAAVLTSCVHTHAAPSALTGTGALGWDVPSGFRDLLVDRATTAARDALADREPVTASFGRVPMPSGVSVNRRGHPLTPEAALLDLRRGDGTHALVLANFAVHPTVSGPDNLAVATDWVGPFRRALRELTGGHVVFLQGCQGDVNPAKEVRAGADLATWTPVADDMARRLAGAMAAGLDAGEPLDVDALVAHTRSIDVPVGDTSLAALAGGRPDRTIELVDWQIGDLTLIAIPGEGFHAVETAARAAHGDCLMLAGIAPDWNGYLPLPYGDGYEESLSLGVEAVATIIAELCTRRVTEATRS